MERLFIGKFKLGDQLDNNYHLHDGLRMADKDSYFNGLREGDYVLPTKEGHAPKLFKVLNFESVNNDVGVRATFETVKTYEPPVSLSNIIHSKYLQPDLVIVNKAQKQTKGVGFHQLQLEPNCPSVLNIDFNQDKRRYIVCSRKKMEDISFFKPYDICVITNRQNYSIEDIVEFKGREFIKYEVFWNLFQEKIGESKQQYTLKELFEFAGPKHDGARNKASYLEKVISSLESSDIFSVDNVVALYDNIIVGRRRSQDPKKRDNDEATAPDYIPEDYNSDYEDLSAYGQYAKLMDFNPNIIFYGPPGTGKTYGAMRVIEAFEEMKGNPITFDQVLNEHRAKFITFHQAYSYEEFVEGIRPRIEGDKISYSPEPGVLKEIAEACRIQGKKKNIKDNSLLNTTSNSKVWKISLGRRTTNEPYRTLRDKSIIAIDFNVTSDVSEWSDSQIDEAEASGQLRALRSKVSVGDIVFIFDSIRTIRLIGVVMSEYFYSDEDSFGYRHRRNVKWLKNCEENPIDIFELNKGKQLSLSSIYELKIPVAAAVSLIDIEEDKDVPEKPYYLIIDEINRGNIAKIFGELITLIEKDKREVLPCTLPYSGDPFTLPKNLYIIGTMNTSDRSIALLDTALRRRFAFIEVTPDITLLENSNPTIGGNVSPARLLQAINNKISEKLDRDHRIGHSYFYGDDLVTKNDLFNVWYYKVLPLLMEYFYNDTKQVSDIVGSEFFNNATGEIIQLDLKANEENISIFENTLIKIYQGED